MAVVSRISSHLSTARHLAFVAEWNAQVYLFNWSIKSAAKVTAKGRQSGCWNASSLIVGPFQCNAVLSLRHRLWRSKGNLQQVCRGTLKNTCQICWDVLTPIKVIDCISGIGYGHLNRGYRSLGDNVRIGGNIDRYRRGEFSRHGIF